MLVFMNMISVVYVEELVFLSWHVIVKEIKKIVMVLVVELLNSMSAVSVVV